MSSLLNTFQAKAQTTSGTGRVLFAFSDKTYTVSMGNTTVSCLQLSGDKIPVGSLVLISKSSTGHWYITSNIGRTDETERQEVIIDG